MYLYMCMYCTPVFCVVAHYGLPSSAQSVQALDFEGIRTDYLLCVLSNPMVCAIPFLDFERLVLCRFEL